MVRKLRLRNFSKTSPSSLASSRSLLDPLGLRESPGLFLSHDGLWFFFPLPECWFRGSLQSWFLLLREVQVPASSLSKEPSLPSQGDPIWNRLSHDPASFFSLHSSLPGVVWFLAYLASVMPIRMWALCRQGRCLNSSPLPRAKNRV